MPRPSLRDAIIDAATTQFHLHGYNGSGVAAITTAAGAPKGSFYNHFASKEQLALEVLDRYAVSMRADMLEAGDGSALDRIRTHFEFLSGELGGFDYRRGCMIGNLAAETATDAAAVAARADAVFREWSERLARAVAAAQDEGDVPADLEPGLVAEGLIDLYEGAAMRAKPTGDADTLRRVLDHAIPRLLGLPG